MNRGTFFPNGAFLAALPKDTFDVAGAKAVVATVDKSAVLAASRNFIVAVV